MGVRVLLQSPVGLQRLPVGTYLLGRGTDCDVVVASARASRRHARLIVTEEGATLEDLSSANGTHVNGVRIDGRQTLAHDDFIVIGETGLEITFESDAEESAVPDLASAQQEIGSETDATLSTRDRQHADKWIEVWAERVMVQARAGTLADDHTARSAIRFGVELARQWRTEHWVDFVIELAGLGVRLPLERARALDPVIEEVGVSKAAFDAFSEKLKSQSISEEQRELVDLVAKWRDKTRA